MNKNEIKEEINKIIEEHSLDKNNIIVNEKDEMIEFKNNNSILEIENEKILF